MAEKNNAQEREIALVLGTAGHIDHGKTTLIAALTGVDCERLDRLAEEKRRGITIELGFAPLHLKDKKGERVVSVIDVPGHEKFIRQMVAGASGIDAALLVVAADEGVMPQTREHLAIMELLGVHDGLVAITKIDRVAAEPELVELVREDIEQFTRGTFLQGKPIIPVSASPEAIADGTSNLDELRREIGLLVDRVKPRSRGGALFLPIDRAFPISGFGTVITGTAYHGTAKLGDEIEVLPALAAGAGSGTGGLAGKLRSIQVHGNSVERAFAGQRVAANLAGIAVDQIQRGDVVCQKNVYAPTTCFDCVIKLLPGEPLKHWQRVHLCIGTSEVLARVALLEGKQLVPGASAASGATCELSANGATGATGAGAGKGASAASDANEGTAAQLVLEEPVVCTSNQKFILRFYSPLITIGGGTVIYPYSHKPRNAKDRVRLKSRIDALRAARNSGERLACLLDSAYADMMGTGMMDANEAARAVHECPEKIPEITAGLVQAGKLAVLAPGNYMSPSCLDALESALVSATREYQKNYPAEAGLPLDAALRTIASANSKLDARTLRSLIALLVEKNSLVLDENRIHTPDFVSRADDAFVKNSEALNKFCRTRGWQLATLDEARAALSLPTPVFNALIQSLKNSRGLSLLGGNYIFTLELEQAMLKILREISAQAPNGGVTLAAVRDATNSTRKFILPVLEYFDSKGYTRRVGDVRVLAASTK